MNINNIQSCTNNIIGAVKTTFTGNIHPKNDTAPVQGNNADNFCKQKTNASFDSIKGDITKKEIEAISTQLHNIAKEDFSDYMKLFQLIFGDMDVEVTGRIKEPSSIMPKLEKRMGRMNGAYSDMVPDLYGFKIISDGSYQTTEKIIKRIGNLVDDGILSPSHFLNHGKYPYFNEEQAEKLSKKGFYAAPSKSSGFTDVNLYFNNLKNGSKIELQIIGDKSNKINTKEHLFYNFKTKGAAVEHGVINKKYQTVFEAMTPDEIEKYNKYVDECYSFARHQELGLKYEKPKLPENFDKILELL